MAEKAGLQVTKVEKFIVNPGQPSEAQYDWVDLSPLGTNNGVSYYRVQLHDEYGLIDDSGEVVFPIAYRLIYNVHLDSKTQRVFVFCEKDGRTLVALLDNPEIHTEGFRAIDPIWNKDRELFFRATDNPVSNLLRFEESPDGGQFVTLIENALGGFSLDGYDCIDVYLDGYGSDEIDKIIDEYGRVVYCAPEKLKKCFIRRLRNAKNAFLIIHYATEPGDINYVDEVPTSIIAEEVLVFVPQEDGSSKMLTVNVPNELLIDRDHEGRSVYWTAFLVRDTGFYDQIVWGYK